MGLTIQKLLSVGGKTLQEAGVENSNNDAEALLCFVTGYDRKDLFLHSADDIGENYEDLYFRHIGRRASGEPLQYIISEQYFLGHRFYVDPAVLIPRQETELLAVQAIDHIKANADVKNVLDLCTGSGVLAISIALACPDLKITASDVSVHALALSVQNADDLGVSDRIVFKQSDLFSAFDDEIYKNVFDLVVTNPPYVRTGDITNLAREIRDYEPSMALDGGADGLMFYHRIAKTVRAYMRPGACIMAEIGSDQGEEVAAIFLEAGYKSIEISQDLNHLDRFFKASLEM